MDFMVKTAMAIERERLMMHRASVMRVLVRRRGRIGLLLARERSRGLLLREDFKDKTKAKSGHLARRGR